MKALLAEILDVGAGVSLTRLEQIVRFGDVLESSIQAGAHTAIAAFTLTVRGTNAMRAAQFASIDRRYDVALWNDDALSGHRGRLICRGACLHDFL